jgi:hypothetical protein
VSASANVEVTTFDECAMTYVNVNVSSKSIAVFTKILLMVFLATDDQWTCIKVYQCHFTELWFNLLLLGTIVKDFELSLRVLTIPC